MTAGQSARERVALTRAPALLVLLVLVVGAASCSEPSPTTTTPTAPAGSTPTGTAAVPGTTPGTLEPVGAPVDYSKPGPYKIGMLRLAMGATQVVVYYPADDKGLAQAKHVTSYSSGEAFGPELKAFVAGLVPELVQDIPIDAYEGAPINPDGPFPVVIHSHGFGGFNLFGSQHFEQEASWGFVVAAPDHLSRDLAAAATNKLVLTGDPDVVDLADTLALLVTQNADPASPVKGGLDTQTVGAEGHSAGGRASYLFAAKEPAVKVWIGQAPSPPIAFDAADQQLTPEEQLAKEQAALQAAPTLGKPSMIVQGEKDSVIPLTGVRVLYEWLQPPKRLMVVKNAGHAAFLDVCKSIRDQGGLEKYAEKLPAFAPLFKLGDDGCGADNIDPVKAYAFINQVMIAEYRFAFGLDPTDVSLSDHYLRTTFPEAFGEAQSVPANP